MWKETTEEIVAKPFSLSSLAPGSFLCELADPSQDLFEA